MNIQISTLKTLARNRNFWFIVGGLVVVSVAVWWWRLPSAADKFDYVRVERGDIRVLLQETGNLAAEHRLNVTSPIAGRIDSIVEKEGTDVKKGAILAWISSTERAAVLDAARARGDEEVKFWESVYKPAPLIAPLDGHLIALSVVPGQVVAPVQTVFVMSDRLILQAYVDETDLHHIRPDQRAEFTLSGFSEKLRLVGSVFQIAYDSSTVNNVTTYMVKVVIEQPPSFLRSGLTADVYFVLNEVSDVLKVPAEFISVDNIVLVATSEKDQPEPRKVTVGASDGNYTEIISGLVENDWVARPKFAIKNAPPGFSFGPKFDNNKNKARATTTGGAPRGR
ncbi:MAG: HlyD family efflux transporter periplasmic adaptor subunit [Verrucomicrobiales bacterium]|jgi:macrolide-specific efflux system membrane fusion protein|nr:HlyD family efflux transporter periplasmic adaptor subunit [Verrucomicrobiales bacterium]